MKFEFIYDPVPIIIIRDIFTKKENKEILEEAVKNKKEFEHSVIGTGKESSFRNNNTSYYDIIYDHDRSKSKLLDIIDTLFKNDKFKQTLISSPYPIHLFSKSNYHETQVSRYGDDGQFYKYHIDSFNDDSRLITMVYYFNEEPKKYNGGEIQFTNSPIYKGKPVDNNAELITIEPENNMAVIFGSRIPHTVLPTTSPKEFNRGRFSVNCWIGIK
jgi:Rps23 Pro-64 3,4-dihydroxylase Tpa1-like proline 4-hydroxylase